MLIYSIYDNKAESCIGPFFVRHEIDAVRSALAAMRDQSTTLFVHAKDYSLKKLGELNEKTGVITPNVEVVTTLVALRDMYAEKKGAKK